MTTLRAVLAAYNSTRHFLEDRQADATGRGTDWARRAELNSYAYFILLFSQLEQYLDRLYAEQIGEVSDAAFLHRVNMVANPSDADQIAAFYSIRCDLAHGYLDPGHSVSILDLVTSTRRYMRTL